MHKKRFEPGDSHCDMLFQNEKSRLRLINSFFFNWLNAYHFITTLCSFDSIVAMETNSFMDSEYKVRKANVYKSIQDKKKSVGWFALLTCSEFLKKYNPGVQGKKKEET